MKIFKTGIVALILSLSTVTFAETQADANAEIIQKTAEKFMQRNNLPGVVVEAYVNGKPYAYYLGYANREKKVPMTQNTIFEIASISKVMTGILVAQQIDFAKMNLNDSLTKYVPNLSESFEDITLKDLATHTSGLPFNLPESVKTNTDLKNYLATVSLEDEAEDQWKYSNFGVGLLGTALENSTHKNYNQLYQAQITKTLGMQPITTVVPTSLMKFYAQGYDKNDKPIAPMSNRMFPAAGGLRASAKDMQKFLSAAIGLPGTPDKIFYPIRMTQAAYVGLSDDTQMGLGWEIHSLASKEEIAEVEDVPAKMNFGPIAVEEVYTKPTFNGDALIDKTGSTDGFRSYIAVIPNKKSGIVILTNRYISNKELVGTAREILFKVNKMYVDKENLEKV